jgi:hypothetical protein
MIADLCFNPNTHYQAPAARAKAIYSQKRGLPPGWMSSRLAPEIPIVVNSLFTLPLLLPSLQGSHSATWCLPSLILQLPWWRLTAK